MTTKSNTKCPLAISHYKDTFRANLSSARPASTWQPPPDAHYFLPRGVMEFSTVNKRDFKAYENAERTKSLKKIEKYVKSEEKLSGTTSYAAEFIPKDLKSTTSHIIVKKNSNETT